MSDKSKLRKLLLAFRDPNTRAFCRRFAADSRSMAICNGPDPCSINAARRFSSKTALLPSPTAFSAVTTQDSVPISITAMPRFPESSVFIPLTLPVFIPRLAQPLKFGSANSARAAPVQPCCRKCVEECRESVMRETHWPIIACRAAPLPGPFGNAPELSGQRLPVDRLYAEFGFVRAMTINTANGTRAPGDRRHFVKPRLLRLRRPPFRRDGVTNTSNSKSILPTCTYGVSACAFNTIIAALVTHCSIMVRRPNATIAGIAWRNTEVSITAVNAIALNQESRSVKAVSLPHRQHTHLPSPT
jgi:hypothetical protein